MRLKVSSIKPNEANPRFITDARYRSLVESLRSFPEMLDARPIIIDENNVILGGNMRYRAACELGYKDVPVRQIKGLPEEKKIELIIRDNVHFADLDEKKLRESWDIDLLSQWGYTMEPSAVFDPMLDLQPSTDRICQLVLNYPKEKFDTVLLDLVKIGEELGYANTTDVVLHLLNKFNK